MVSAFAPAAAKLPQSCPTLCDPVDCSPPASSVPGVLQARTLEWGAISFSILLLNRTLNGKKKSRFPTTSGGGESEGTAEGVHPVGRSNKELAEPPTSKGGRRPPAASTGAPELSPACLGFRGHQQLQRRRFETQGYSEHAGEVEVGRGGLGREWKARGEVGRRGSLRGEGQNCSSQRLLQADAVHTQRTRGRSPC